MEFDQEFVETVAVGLPGWAVDHVRYVNGDPTALRDMNGRTCYSFVLVNGTGAQVFVDFRKGKIEAWGVFNYDRNRLSYTEEPKHGSHKIAVSADRGPEVVAKEIARRLLPDYLREFGQWLPRVAEAYRNVAATAELAEKLGVWHGDGAGRSWVEGYSSVLGARITISDGRIERVTVDLDSRLPQSDIDALIALLKKNKAI